MVVTCQPSEKAKSVTMIVSRQDACGRCSTEAIADWLHSTNEIAWQRTRFGACPDHQRVSLTIVAVAAANVVRWQVDKESPRKELVLSERQAKLTQAVQKFKPGHVVSGEIHRIEDYGALVNIVLKGKATGVQGLLHKSELSWDLVMRTDDVVQQGESVLLVRVWSFSTLCDQVL